MPRSTRARSAPSRYAFLGDLVGYGADPVAVLDLDRRARGARRVRRARQPRRRGARPQRTGLNSAALAAVAWTQRASAQRQRAFLAGAAALGAPRQRAVRPRERRRARALELHHRRAPGGAKHARGQRAATSSAATCTSSGSTTSERTEADAVPARGRDADPDREASPWLAIVGSAGQPRDRNNAACYALADLERAR